VEVAAWSYDKFNLRTDEGVEPLYAVVATGNYFRMLGARPALGRFFEPSDDVRGNPNPVAVLSEAGWRRHLGGEESAVGRTIRLNGEPVTVIGVAPRRFTGTTIGISPDLWIPMALNPRLKAMPSLLEDRQIRYYNLLGRLAPGVTRRQAEAALNVRAGQIEREHIAGLQPRIQLRPTSGLPVQGRRAVIGYLGLLFATAMLVLLIASVNVAGVLLARAAARRKEMAIRLAIGAGRGRLIRQLLTESGLLFLLGGAAGILLSQWILDLLLGLPLPIGGSVVLDLGLDARVLGFALVLSLLTGMAFGLVPALQATRTYPVSHLKEVGLDRRRSLVHHGFVVGQLAMTVVLLAGAGLLFRAVHRAATLDPGFETKGMVFATFDFRLNGYDPGRGRELLQAMRQRIEALPGVQSTSLSHAVPLGRMNWAFARIEVPGHPDTPRDGGVRANMNWIDSDYFRTMRIPMVGGREFTEADDIDARPVAIVSETLARRFWPGGDPIGSQIRVGSDLLWIVGIARDVQDRELGQGPGLYFYRPLEQSPSPVVALLARTSGSEAALLAEVRATTRTLDPNAPLMNAAIFRDWIAMSFLPQRLAAMLTGIAGLAGLLLAAVGLYGVIGYSVAQRTREIGIRMALGAGHEDVMKLVMRKGIALVLLGVGFGGFAALAATRVLSSLLFGVSPADPVVFTGVVSLLTLVALAASYLPARRAIRVDPMIALRTE
jgi:predicted permease